MARSQLNHGPGHGLVMAQSRQAVTILVTVSSRWAVTVANFFLMGHQQHRQQHHIWAQSGGSEFDPRWVHHNLSVPLWVYMRCLVPEHQHQTERWVFVCLFVCLFVWTLYIITWWQQWVQTLTLSTELCWTVCVNITWFTSCQPVTTLRMGDNRSIMPHMDWQSANTAMAFKLFKQRCQLFFRVKNITSESHVDHILQLGREERLRRFNSWTLTDEDAKKPEIIWDKFSAQIEPASNYCVARLFVCTYSASVNWEGSLWMTSYPEWGYKLRNVTSVTAQKPTATCLNSSLLGSAIGTSRKNSLVNQRKKRCNKLSRCAACMRHPLPIWNNTQKHKHPQHRSAPSNVRSQSGRSKHVRTVVVTMRDNPGKHAQPMVPQMPETQPLEQCVHVKWPGKPITKSAWTSTQQEPPTRLVA